MTIGLRAQIFYEDMLNNRKGMDSLVVFLFLIIDEKNKEEISFASGKIAAHQQMYDDEKKYIRLADSQRTLQGSNQPIKFPVTRNKTLAILFNLSEIKPHTTDSPSWLGHENSI